MVRKGTRTPSNSRGRFAYPSVLIPSPVTPCSWGVFPFSIICLALLTTPSLTRVAAAPPSTKEVMSIPLSFAWTKASSGISSSYSCTWLIVILSSSLSVTGAMLSSEAWLSCSCSGRAGASSFLTAPALALGPDLGPELALAELLGLGASTSGPFSLHRGLCPSCWDRIWQCGLPSCNRGR